MKLAVITRTSDRPNLFNRCCESLKRQKIDIEHHVIVDNQASKDYVNGHDIHMVHQVDRSSLQKSYNEPAPESASPKKHAIHNLYFNVAYDHIESDWVYHLDDDNFLLPDSVHTIMPLLTDDVDMMITRADTFAGVLPRYRDCVMRRIKLCAIDTGCFVARTSLLKQVKWDGWKCGDYRVIKQCDRLSRKTLWANKVLMRMEINGDGLRQDRVVDFSKI